MRMSEAGHRNKRYRRQTPLNYQKGASGLIGLKTEEFASVESRRVSAARRTSPTFTGSLMSGSTTAI
eukprot:5308246-Amphidinium_carterae.1